MTRRLAFLLLSTFLAAATVAEAQVAGAPTIFRSERDMLLTTSGKLFTVERETIPSPDGESLPKNYLTLQVRKGDTVKRFVVPETDAGGIPSAPSLAYDSSSDTLFIFWQKQPNHLGSNLLLCTYRDGEWGPITSIDAAAFHYRSNLKIGVTRFADKVQKEGPAKPVASLSLHAIWWDEDAYGESARYALVQFENGRVQSIVIRNLIDFAGKLEELRAPDSPDLDRDFFRHPAIFETPSHDSVDIVFADPTRNRFHRVSVRPAIPLDNGYIRLPVGRHRGAFDAPRRFQVEGGVSVVMDRNAEKLLFYSKLDKGVRYLMHSPEGWSEVRKFDLGDDLTVESGVNLLRKMIESE